jgi:hypothetical protein
LGICPVTTLCASRIRWVTLSLQTGGQRLCNQAQILHKSHAQHLGAQLLLAHTQVAQCGLRNTIVRSF